VPPGRAAGRAALAQPGRCRGASAPLSRAALQPRARQACQGPDARSRVGTSQSTSVFCLGAPRPHTKRAPAGNCLASADGLEGLRPCGSLATLDLARNRIAELAALPAALDAALRSLCLVGNPLVAALRCAPAAARARAPRR